MARTTNGISPLAKRTASCNSQPRGVASSEIRTLKKGSLRRAQGTTHVVHVPRFELKVSVTNVQVLYNTKESKVVLDLILKVATGQVLQCLRGNLACAEGCVEAGHNIHQWWYPN